MQIVVFLLSLLQVLHVIQNLQMLMNELKICLLCVHEVIVYRLMNLYFRQDSIGLEIQKMVRCCQKYFRHQIVHQKLFVVQ